MYIAHFYPQYNKKDRKMCDETSEEIKEELEEVDKEHGGGPETDREKERREKYAKLHGSDRDEQDE